MDRSRRYPSDLTDRRWELIEPMLPLPKWMGRPEKHPRRAIVDAILYVVRTGCAWRYLPADFPPWETVYGRFRQWNKRGVIERILTELREQVRIAQGRNPEPSAGIIDSQSVKTADTVPKVTQGYDGGNYLGRSVMPGQDPSDVVPERLARHNYRFSRKARSVSGGR
jgi:transposase